MGMGSGGVWLAVWAVAVLVGVVAAVAVYRSQVGMRGITSAQVALGTQVGELTHFVAALGQQVTLVRAEARQDAVETRAQSAEAQAVHAAQLNQQVHEALLMTEKQLAAMRQTLHERIAHFNGTMGEQLGAQGRVMLELHSQLGGLSESTRKVEQMGQELVSLQDILRAPKLRGNLGEFFLEELLRQVLPPEAFSFQYRLPGPDNRGGSVIVDAVIRLRERLVPVDAKFPLETFARLQAASTDEERVKRRKEFADVVCKHIDAIADKYIRPEAGTYDFALMYLPAEGVYYEAMVRQEPSGERSIVAHAAGRKVVPVSPNTFYGYLLTVAYGLKGLQIERQAEAIREQIATFQKNFGAFHKLFEKVGRHLDLAHRGFDDAERRGQRLQDHVAQITGIALASGAMGNEPDSGDPLLTPGEVGAATGRLRSDQSALPEA